MSKDTSYEFRYVPPEERRKVLAAKAIIFLICAVSLIGIAVGDWEVSTRFAMASWVASGIFVYTNVQKVRVELEEVITPGFDYEGVEYIVLGLLLNLYSFYLNLV
ncbi:MAG: hypothetical protein ACE37D_08130 [Pseudomonadales bacterium]